MNLEAFQDHLRSMSLDETLQADTVFGASFMAGQGGLGDLPITDAAVVSRSGLELGHTLGEGGMGVVRAATQLQLHREVAVKTLRKSPSMAQRKALLLEALITGGLQHPSIVPVYALAESDEGLPIIVMKLVEGVTWQACIQDPTLAPGIDLTDTLGWHLDVLSQVCQAVHYAHSRGIIHRDIKPENVMLGEFGEVYLVDWGIALTTDPDKAKYLLHTNAAHGIAGTPSYMAPEMTFGEGSLITPQTDIYLLGASLAEVLAGEPPHRGKTLFELLYRAHESAPIKAEGVSQPLLDICHKAMAKEPNERYCDAAALRRALQEHLSHRASIRLAEIAAERLSALPDTPNAFRIQAAEVHFGLTEALNIWPQNPTALVAKSQWLRAMVGHELADGHLPAARALLAEVPDPPDDLLAQVEAAQITFDARQTKFEGLEEHRAQSDLGVGAKFRSRIALIAAFFWTVVPLADGYLTEWGEKPVSHVQFVLQSAGLLGFLGIAAFLFRRKIRHHRANRQILRLALSFSALIPLFRIGVLTAGIPTNTGLAMELGIYGLMFGGIGILSGRSGLPTILLYGVASVGATLYPGYVEVFLAGANLIAITWLGWIWARLDDRAVPVT